MHHTVSALTHARISRGTILGGAWCVVLAMGAVVPRVAADEHWSTNADPNFADAKVFSWSSLAVTGPFDVADLMGNNPNVEPMSPDGWADVAVITDRSITVLRNSQNWSPGNGLVLHRQFDTGDFHGHDIRLADMNNDGLRDIVITADQTNTSSNKIVMYFNNGDGTFGEVNEPYNPDDPHPNSVMTLNDGNYILVDAWGLATLDLDGDNVREVIAAGSITSSGARPATAVAHRPSGGWGYTIGTDEVDIYHQSGSLTINTICRDLTMGLLKDEDMNPGFAATFNFDPNLATADGLGFGFNSGSGATFSPTSFTQIVGVQSPGITNALFRPSLSYNDLAQTKRDPNSGVSSINVIENDGDGTVSSLSNLDTIQIDQTDGLYAYGITSGKLTTDGYADFAVACEGDPGGVLVYRGAGDLTFTGPFIFGSDDAPRFIKAYEMNQDCREDLITAANGALEIRVYLNRMPVSCN